MSQEGIAGPAPDIKKPSLSRDCGTEAVSWIDGAAKIGLRAPAMKADPCEHRVSDVEASMNHHEIRKRSMRVASGLGYRVNNSLPLLEGESVTRTPLEIINRLLCLHVTAASAFGFDRSTARAWLQREGASDALSPAERHFLNVGGDSTSRFKLQVEAAWALAWTLQLVSTFDFSKECDKTFVSVLPNLKISERSERLRENACLHIDADIIMECDLAYCLHGPPGKHNWTGIVRQEV